MPRSSTFARLPSYPLSLCLLVFLHQQKIILASPLQRGSSERSVHSVKTHSATVRTGNEIDRSGRLNSTTDPAVNALPGSLPQAFHPRSDRKKRDGWRARDPHRTVAISSSSPMTSVGSALNTRSVTINPPEENQFQPRETESVNSGLFLNKALVVKADTSDNTRATPSLRACSRVPYTVEKTCRRQVYSQRAYSCASDFYPTLCKDRPRAFVFDCWQKKTRDVSYACPKMQTKKLCYKVPKVVAGTCKRTVSRWKRGECIRKIQELHCNLQTVDKPTTCFSTETYTEPYACEKFQTRLDCQVSFEVQEGACSREVDVPITYEYEDTETENVCEKKQRAVRKKCFNDVVLQELQQCEQTVHEPRCEKVPQQQQKTCSGKKIRAETYPCQEIKMQQAMALCTRMVPLHKKKRSSCRSPQEPGCKAGEDKSKSVPLTVETYPCEKVIPVAVPSLCTREVTYDAEYPCAEIVLVEQCSMQERQVETMCPTVVVKREEYECEEIQEEEECYGVPRKTRKTGVLRVDKRTENFPCEKPISAESCVEVPEVVSAVCSAELMRATEKSCTTKRKMESCEVIEKMVPGICSEEEQVEEEYLCSRVEFTEDWIMGECSEEIEEEVKVSCTEEVLEEECSPQPNPQEKTCFEDVEEEEKYTCYDVQYKEECQDYAG